MQQQVLEKQRLEAEKRKEKDELQKQEELERLEQGRIKAEKIELVNQIGAKLNKNKEIFKQLGDELRNLEAEKRLSSG